MHFGHPTLTTHITQIHNINFIEFRVHTVRNMKYGICTLGICAILQCATEWCNDDLNYFCCLQLFHLPNDHLQLKFYIQTISE